MAKIHIHSARTDNEQPAQAAEELVKQLGDSNPKLVTLYATRAYDHRALNAAVRARLPKSTRLIGATTSAPIDNTGMHFNGAALGALTGDFEVGLGIGHGLSVDAMSAGNQAISRAREELGVRPVDIDTRHYVGCVIDDGYRYKKEELLLGILEKNPSLLLVGGGASDHEQDPAKQMALVHLDGEVAGDAAVLALFRTDAPFAALRHHAYMPTGRTLTITKLDDTQKRVLEIDGKPATQRYAELLGISIDELDYPNQKGFGGFSLALRVGREYFMRSPWFPNADGSILFANLLQEGTELELMRLGNMAESTVKFFQEELPRRVQSPQCVLLFNCTGRVWLSQAAGTVDQLSDSFKSAPPAIGMNAWFETYCGFHISSTLTMLAFGANE